MRRRAPFEGRLTGWREESSRGRALITALCISLRLTGRQEPPPRKERERGRQARACVQGGWPGCVLSSWPALQQPKLTAYACAEYAQVLKMLGNGRVEAMCFDGEKRLAHIRGKMRKKVRWRVQYGLGFGWRRCPVKLDGIGVGGGAEDAPRISRHRRFGGWEIGLGCSGAAAVASEGLSNLNFKSPDERQLSRSPYDGSEQSASGRITEPRCWAVLLAVLLAGVGLGATHHQTCLLDDRPLTFPLFAGLDQPGRYHSPLAP